MDRKRYTLKIIWMDESVRIIDIGAESFQEAVLEKRSYQRDPMVKVIAIKKTPVVTNIGTYFRLASTSSTSYRSYV